VRTRIYLEGGGDTRDTLARCREGFRKLLENCGFTGRMPRLFASGGRGTAYDDFKTAHESSVAGDYVAMLIDSEEPMADIEKTWAHLAKYGPGKKPKGAHDDQVLLMVTCMETWIVADRAALAAHYGAELREKALSPLVNLEDRQRHDVQDCLTRATRKCGNAYAKGKRSFEILKKLDPEALAKQLPSCARVRRILNKKL
jgi:hypothetical protein